MIKFHIFLNKLATLTILGALLFVRPSYLQASDSGTMTPDKFKRLLESEILRHEVRDAHDLSWICQVARKIPADRSAEFVKTANALIHPDMPEAAKFRIISGVVNVPADRYAEFVKFVSIANSWIAPQNDRSVVISRGMAEVPADLYTEEFVRTVNAWITPQMDSEERSLMIRELAKVPADRYTEAFFRTAKALITPDMDGLTRSDIISDLAETVPVDRYAEFVRIANSWITPYMSGKDRSWIISGVAKVPADRYAEFVRTTNALIHPDMPEESKATIISGVARVPVRDYNICRPLVCGVPFAQRRNILQRFSFRYTDAAYMKAIRALLMSRWTEEGEIGQRRLEVLETDLKNPLRVLRVGGLHARNLRDVYAEGVNIHARDRDAKTCRAFELLMSLWTPSDGDIQTYSQDYINHVRRSGNAIALAVLMGGVENIERLPGFGSLMQGSRHLLQGRYVSTTEILAHLWHFVEVNVREVSPDDVDNAKESLIQGLARGVDGTDVVCDPGKLQRLATATLQGRLVGVQIDEEIPVEESARMVRPLVNIQALHIQDEGHREPQRPIRNMRGIEEYLTPLFMGWNTSGYPETARECFHQTFEYWENLAEGRVRGTDGRSIILDPRDVVFYMIFGKGITQPMGNLETEFGMVAQYDDLFQVEDYIEMYKEQERTAFLQAKEKEEEV